MRPPAILAVEFLVSLLAYSLVAKWYVWPRIAGWPFEAALRPLLLVHLVRPVSLWLLAPGVIVSATLPSEFATGTAYGDLLAAALALATLTALPRAPRLGVALAWLFSGVGALDALRNVAVGVRLQVAEHMGAAVLVPAYGVPLLFVTHVLVVLRLLRHLQAGRPRRLPA